MKNKICKILILLIVMFSVFSGITFEKLNLQYANSFDITKDEMQELYPAPPMTLEVQDNGGESTLIYKLFNIFNIKTLKGRIRDEGEVYLGGYPLGVSVHTEGVMITAVGSFVTDSGLRSPAKDSGIKSGDILVEINGIAIQKAADIDKPLEKAAGKPVELKIKRGTEYFNVTVTPEKDALNKNYRIGLSVRDAVTGVGTLTYIKSDKRFGALGHHIADFETGLIGELNRGRIFKATIIGVVKGKKGEAGELRGVFNKYDKGIGTIDKNNEFGIFGVYTSQTEAYKTIKIGGAAAVKAGKAQIYTTIDGNKPDFYDIEIIKTQNQDSPATKSMVISVTDKRLIEATGGIVQGMSGSPIVQNGKIIGAVTHVFISDPTKGYGVYINWMLEQGD